MSNCNKALMHRWFEEVWNEGRAEAVDEMFAHDGIAHGLVDEHGKELSGPAAFKPFVVNFRRAFPDIEVIIEDTIAEDDEVAVRCRVRGTHLGEGINLAPTQHSVEFTGICITRIKDGKIVEAWNNFDFMSMFQQIDAAQRPTSSPAPEA
ncbi:MAG: ester cyclase [Acidobacteriota bacterium]